MKGIASRHVSTNCEIRFCFCFSSNEEVGGNFVKNLEESKTTEMEGQSEEVFLSDAWTRCGRVQ
jgi:hypothetical protein